MSAIKMNEATPVTLCTVSAARALSDPPQQSSRARQYPRSRIRRASSKLRDRAAMAVVISAASAQAPNRTNSASSDAECRDGRHDISLCDQCPSKPRRNRPTKRLKDAILKMPKLAIALTAVLLSTPAIAQVPADGAKANRGLPTKARCYSRGFSARYCRMPNASGDHSPIGANCKLRSLLRRWRRHPRRGTSCQLRPRTIYKDF